MISKSISFKNRCNRRYNTTFCCKKESKEERPKKEAMIFPKMLFNTLKV